MLRVGRNHRKKRSEKVGDVRSGEFPSRVRKNEAERLDNGLKKRGGVRLKEKKRRKRRKEEKELRKSTSGERFKFLKMMGK